MPIELPPIAGSADDLSSYLTVGEADALAEQMPALSAWNAAAAEEKARALKQATADVDNALRYQGRKYDPAQPRQFPRMAYSAGAGEGDEVIWDWDDVASAATVPMNVKLAALYQADSILTGRRQKALEAWHDGLASQTTGQLQESYRPTRPAHLCLAAYELMRPYALRSGQIL